MLFVLLLLSGLLISGWWLLYRLPLLLLQPVRRHRDQTPAEFGLDFTHLRLSVAPEVTLDCFFVPANGIASANLIILHGVGSCKETYLPLLPRLSDMGYNLLLVDQRAHGKSGGTYLTYGHYEKEDLRQMVDWLAERTAALPTGVYGNSMGGAVALQGMAQDSRLSFGLIESTFTDLPTIFMAYARQAGFTAFPASVLRLILYRAGRIAAFDPWSIRPLVAVTKLQQPILFIHGTADGRIDVEHARQLFARCTSVDKALYLVPGGDHADLPVVGGQAYQARFFDFLQEMLTRSQFSD